VLAWCWDAEKPEVDMPMLKALEKTGGHYPA
jgi:hypothetical protein